MTSPIQLDVTAISAYIDEDFELNTYQWSLFEGIVERLNEKVEAAGGNLLVMLLPIIFNPREIETMTGGTFERRFETPAGLVTIRSAEPRERLAKLSQRLDIHFSTRPRISSISSRRTNSWRQPGLMPPADISPKWSTGS